VLAGVLVPLGLLAVAGIFLAWRYWQRKKREDTPNSPVEIDSEPVKRVYELPTSGRTRSDNDLSIQQTPTEMMIKPEKHPWLPVTTVPRLAPSERVKNC
jgi:hypothetical protein